MVVMMVQEAGSACHKWQGIVAPQLLEFMYYLAEHSIKCVRVLLSPWNETHQSRHTQHAFAVFTTSSKFWLTCSGQSSRHFLAIRTVVADTVLSSNCAD